MVVPMPTFPPLVAKYAEPLEVKAVVEAYGNTEAMEEVAVKKLAVGDDVATRVPEEFVDITELGERPMKEIVPVAVMLAAVTFPEKRPLPWTERS